MHMWPADALGGGIRAEGGKLAETLQAGDVEGVG